MTRRSKARPQYPVALERAYLSAASKHVKALNTRIRAALADTTPSEALERLNELRALRMPLETLERIGAQLDLFSTRQVARLVGEVIAIDAKKLNDFMAAKPLKPMIEEWARTNASLISNATNATIDQVSELVVEAQASGMSTKALTNAVQRRLQVSESRARLIARDQLGTLNGNLNQQRQTSLGLTEYIWETSQDERVRPEHALRQGLRFSWDDPPFDGHPSEPIQCRCVARPVIPKDLDIFGENDDEN